VRIVSPSVLATSFTLPSFAKLNWNLRVLGKRHDGYHELSTVFQTISLSDTISFSPADSEEVVLECDNPALSTGSDNLILRAANGLKTLSGCRAGARISLTKRIPFGGGLGGGSSNAAIALIGLAKLWNLWPESGELLQAAAQLGADVPFFLVGGTAHGSGIGEKLVPVAEVSAPHLLVVSPGVAISTAEAFKALNLSALTKDRGEDILSVSYAEAFSSLSLPEVLFNDFEAVVFQMVPQVGLVKKSLESLGARVALMSGSGSSVFGIFENRESLEFARRELERKKGWRVFSCSTVSREEYRRLLGPCAAFLHI
jgi:4-diphosphocytidyl-2-C-methyl-D-erythritol kinase